MILENLIGFSYFHLQTGSQIFRHKRQASLSFFIKLIMTCLYMPKRSDFRNLTWWIFNTSSIRTVHSSLFFSLYNPPTGRNNVKKGQKEGEKENQRMEIQFLFLVTLNNYALKRFVPDRRKQVVFPLGKIHPHICRQHILEAKGMKPIVLLYFLSSRSVPSHCFNTLSFILNWTSSIPLTASCA